MKKNLEAYSETLFHLITFRYRQYVDSKSMIGIEYDSFMILSCIGAHHLTHNTSRGADWDSVWVQTRPKEMNEHYGRKKLTIFSVANIMQLPKETVRRKIEILKKKKLISYSGKLGLLPTSKVEEVIKPFAEKELIDLSNFLQALKKHKALEPILNLK
jgi:hypothetical protein